MKQTNENDFQHQNRPEIPLDVDVRIQPPNNTIENRLAREEHRVILVEEKVIAIDSNTDELEMNIRRMYQSTKR